MDAAGVQSLLDEAFDQAIVHHGFVDYMRDYGVVLYCTADPLLIPPRRERVEQRAFAPGALRPCR